jgi:hypothetical protein
MNNLKIVTPALNAGKYRIAVTNPDGETTSLDRRLYRQLKHSRFDESPVGRSMLRPGSPGR